MFGGAKLQVGEEVGVEEGGKHQLIKCCEEASQ